MILRRTVEAPGATAAASLLLVLASAGIVGPTTSGGEPEAPGELAGAAKQWVVGRGGEDWLKSAEFDKAYVRYDGVQLLNGYNPANEWSCWSGGECGRLDARMKVSSRFTSQLTKTVAHVEVWPFFLVGTPSLEIRTGLQGDVGGEPNGEWLGSGTFTTKIATRKEIRSRRKAYTTMDAARVKLDKPARVKRGKVYHVVSQYESGKADERNYVMFAGVATALETVGGSASPGAVPRSFHGDSNVSFRDPALMALQFDGTKWQEHATRKVPWFVLIHSDGTFQGVSAWHWREDLTTYRWGNAWAGQLVQVRNVDKEVTQLGVPLRRTRNPEDDLHYEIRDSKETVLREGILARKGGIPEVFSKGAFTWFYGDLAPLLLKKGQTYRIVLKTPGSTDRGGRISTDAGGFIMEPYTKAKPQYALTSYGGTDSVFTVSFDGGRSWQTHPGRDMSFRLKLKETLSGSVTSAAKDAEGVSGAGATWHRLKVEGEIPERTRVDLFISSSDDRVTWSDFVPVKEAARSAESYPLPRGHRKRHMKWRLVLRTKDVRVSPKLARVSVEAKGAKGERKAAQGSRLRGSRRLRGSAGGPRDRRLWRQADVRHRHPNEIPRLRSG